MCEDPRVAFDTLCSMRVHENPYIKPVPKIQLSHSFTACSPSFKVEFNRWLLERFGTKEVMYVIGGSVFLSPKHLALLRMELAK